MKSPNGPCSGRDAVILMDYWKINAQLFEKQSIKGWCHHSPKVLFGGRSKNFESGNIQGLDLKTLHDNARRWRRGMS